MDIKAIAVKFPSLKIKNDDIIELIRNNSLKSNKKYSKDYIDNYLQILSKLLNNMGCQSRFIRNVYEKPIDLIIENVNLLLEENAVEKQSIDMLIYCGVGRGFIEPGNAYFIARDLNLDCDCFDISDACMSWVRALNIAYHYLKEEKYYNVLVINAEFTVKEYGLENFLNIKTLDELAYNLPAYTIGECTTATLLTKSPTIWSFSYKSFPKFADLCTICLPGFEGFTSKIEKLNLNGLLNFTSFGKEILEYSSDEMIRLLLSMEIDFKEYDYFIPHAATYDLILSKASNIGINSEKILLDHFKHYGNLVSASIPTAIYLSEKKGIIKRGQRLLLCPMSAGISVGTVDFIY